MKRIALFVMAAVSLLVIPPAFGVQADSMLENGDFSAGLAGWTVAGSRSPFIATSSQCLPSHSGNNALAMDVPNGWAYAEQTVTLQGESTLSFRTWGQLDPVTVAVYLMVDGVPTPIDTFVPVRLIASYTLDPLTFSCTGALPETKTYDLPDLMGEVTLVLYASSSGYDGTFAIFDDFELKTGCPSTGPCPTLTASLRNGNPSPQALAKLGDRASFEGSGWSATGGPITVSYNGKTLNTFPEAKTFKGTFTIDGFIATCAVELVASQGETTKRVEIPGYKMEKILATAGSVRAVATNGRPARGSGRALSAGDMVCGGEEVSVGGWNSGFIAEALEDTDEYRGFRAVAPMTGVDVRGVDALEIQLWTGFGRTISAATGHAELESQIRSNYAHALTLEQPFGGGSHIFHLPQCVRTLAAGIPDSINLSGHEQSWIGEFSRDWAADKTLIARGDLYLDKGGAVEGTIEAVGDLILYAGRVEFEGTMDPPSSPSADSRRLRAGGTLKLMGLAVSDAGTDEFCPRSRRRR